MSKPLKLTNKFPVKTAYGIFTAALLAFTSLTFPGSETENKAYVDKLGRNAICRGHTSGVKKTDIVTDDQCDEFLYQDMFTAVHSALTITPKILNNNNAFRAVVEFIMTTDVASYESSPMAVHFKEEKWDEGCTSLLGYKTAVEFKKKEMDLDCQKSANGNWMCVVPELVNLRQEQYLICSGNL